MTIQAIKDLALPNGIRIRQGGVLSVPDDLAARLIHEGLARPHEPPGPTERKDARDMLPPPILAPNFVRVPTGPASVRAFEPGAYEDRDNFVCNLVTVAGFYWPWWATNVPAEEQRVPPVRAHKSMRLQPCRTL